MWQLPDPRTDNLLGSIAIIDTNVMLELLSWHDVYNALETTQDVNSPEVVSRRARARGSLILFEYLHRRKAHTLNLGLEPLKILEKQAPPESGGWKAFYVSFALHYLMPVFWKGWDSINVNEDFQDEPLRNAADDALIEIARRYRLPLISNEGTQTDGTLDIKNRMQRKAVQAGITVLRPADFWAGKIDPVMARTRVLNTFDRWLIRHLMRPGRDRGTVRQAAPHIRAYLAWALDAP